MSSEPTTRATLLLRIRDHEDQESWKQFVDIYAPILMDYASRKGMQHQDASDVVQEVMQAVANSIEQFQYDPSQGRFRGWLHTLTRNQIINHQKRNARHQAAGDTAVQQLLSNQPDSTSDDDNDWNGSFHQQLMQYAMEELQKEFPHDLWQAFYQTAVEGKKPREVAQSLRMTTGHVYVAKSRILTKIRVFVRELGG